MKAYHEYNTVYEAKLYSNAALNNCIFTFAPRWTSQVQNLNPPILLPILT